MTAFKPQPVSRLFLLSITASLWAFCVLLGAGLHALWSPLPWWLVVASIVGIEITAGLTHWAGHALWTLPGCGCMRWWYKYVFFCFFDRHHCFSNSKPCLE